MSKAVEKKKTPRKRNYYMGKMPITLSVTPAVKIWSNGIPVKADTYRSCSVTCGYCYARAMTAGMVQHAGMKYQPRLARVMKVKYEASQFEKALTGEPGWMYWAIRNRYFIELGTMAEVFQEEDKEMRVSWNFLKLTGAFNIPLLINTKAPLLVRDESYFNLIRDYPAPVIMSMTMIGLDDKLVKKHEPNAPLISERLKLISDLKKIGIPTVVYLAPFINGVSDVDPEGFIDALIEAGAVGLHLRNFYITGKMTSVNKWMKYMETNKDTMARYGQGKAHTSEYLMTFYNRMQAQANKRDPRFQIVGMKTSWFDLNAHHGKMAMDWLPDAFKDGIIDFTALPILRKIRENMDSPQLLKWEEIGYKKELVNHPRAVPIGEGWNSESAWLNKACMGCIGGMDAPRGKRWMSGWEWVKGGLWNGLKFSGSFMNTVNRIYPVMDNGEIALDNDGNHVLTYIPPEQRDEFVVRDEDTKKDYVPLDRTSTFIVPKRKGGTEDKFENRPDLAYDLGDKWK